jgi:uncharacterized protein YbjT (DUF2867 family)
MRAVFQEGKVKRKDVFVGTKLWNNNHRPERVRAAFEASLRRLQLDYVDLIASILYSLSKPRMSKNQETRTVPPAATLLAAEAAANVRHHVALSIVGIDRTENGHFHAKVAQEKLVNTFGIPYIIIRSTQFLEFLGGIAASSADGNMVRLSPVLFQPIAADGVAAAVGDVALAAARSGIVGTAGPERAPFNEIIARCLKAVGDPRVVVSVPRGPILGRPGRGRFYTERKCRADFLTDERAAA